MSLWCDAEVDSCLMPTKRFELSNQGGYEQVTQGERCKRYCQGQFDARDPYRNLDNQRAVLADRAIPEDKKCGSIKVRVYAKVGTRDLGEVRSADYDFGDAYAPNCPKPKVELWSATSGKTNEQFGWKDALGTQPIQMSLDGGPIINGNLERGPKIRVTIPNYRCPNQPTTKNVFIGVNEVNSNNQSSYAHHWNRWATNISSTQPIFDLAQLTSANSDKPASVVDPYWNTSGLFHLTSGLITTIGNGASSSLVGQPRHYNIGVQLGNGIPWSPTFTVIRINP